MAGEYFPGTKTGRVDAAYAAPTLPVRFAACCQRNVSYLSAITFVTFGSTEIPGPNVVDTVAFWT